MTDPYAGLDERPAPVLLPDGGMVVPAPLCAELAGALELLAGFLRGTPPPASCRAPRLSQGVLVVMRASGDAAVAYRRRQTRMAASAAPTVTVLPPAQPVASSEQMVTTAVAAEVVGVSPEWVRRLAADGVIRAARAPRNTWTVHLEDLRAYRAGHPRRSSTDGSNADSDQRARRGAA